MGLHAGRGRPSSGGVRVANRLGSRGWTLALGLLLGGALGNLIDRLSREPGFARGHVVDFIDYGDWFIGNVADIAIVVAACLIAILGLRGIGLDGSGRGADGAGLGDATAPGRRRCAGRCRHPGRRPSQRRSDASRGGSNRGERRPLAARARRARGRAGRRRARPDVRPLAHPCRRSSRRAARCELDGRDVGKSDRLPAGAWLEVTSRPLVRASRPVVVAEPVPGMRIIYDDDDFVVVDKPVGVAAHPSLGWTGPTVVGGLAAAGYRISTSGAAERQGIVHRLDVGTSGLMVVAKSEHAYTVLKRAFKERTVDKVYHAVVQGLPTRSAGTIDAPDRPPPGPRLQVRGHRGRQAPR